MAQVNYPKFEYLSPSKETELIPKEYKPWPTEWVRCEECGGSGRMRTHRYSFQYPCMVCDGRGQVEQVIMVSVA